MQTSHRIDSEEFYRLLQGQVIDDATYSQLSSRLALMAALLGMIARPSQPKSTPAVIAMATIAASRLKLLFPCTSLSGRRTVEAPRTLCTEATVSVAPGSLFRGRRS